MCFVGVLGLEERILVLRDFERSLRAARGGSAHPLLYGSRVSDAGRLQELAQDQRRSRARRESNDIDSALAPHGERFAKGSSA